MADAGVSAASFVASLVSSLAWPAVIVAILVIFHRQFGTMLDRLARVRLGASSTSGAGAPGAEADQDWSAAEAAVRQSLTAARPPGPALPGGPPGPPGAPGAAGTSGAPGAGRDGSGRAGGSAPGPDAAAQQALVEDRWQALSGELRDVIARSDPAGAKWAGSGFDQLLDTALRAGLLDSATVRSLDGLARLRTLARTSAGLTERQAQEFGVLADAVSYSMRRSVPAGGGPVQDAAWPAS
jgi:hypothetical protein